MVKGELDGTTAFMQGKLRVAGDMGLAMKLGPDPAEGARLISFEPRFFTARDGTRLRAGVFAAAPATRGICVLLHGQTEFIEKYEEVIGELNARGFTVATFDWRGQGASARALADPLKSYVKDFAQFDDDLRASSSRSSSR